MNQMDCIKIRKQQLLKMMIKIKYRKRKEKEIKEKIKNRMNFKITNHIFKVITHFQNKMIKFQVIMILTLRRCFQILFKD